MINKCDYDYLIVGAGLSGAVFAYQAKQNGKRCLVIDKRRHVGGNAFTFRHKSIMVHKYGPHIFHTNDARVWSFMKKFGEFNNYIHSPTAISNGRVYNLPFNMNTFYSIWGVQTPKDALGIINRERELSVIESPKNLEEWALNAVGPTIYKTLIKEYTEKQWGCDATELPPEILKRIPIRFMYNNNYFSNKFQGIPTNGYTEMISKMLSGVDVVLECDFFRHKELRSAASKIIFTGQIDQFYDFCYGELSYRSLSFSSRYLKDVDNFQGNSVVNYIDKSIPYTRVVEHKHFCSDESKGTIITKEYPKPWSIGDEAYYPISTHKNIHRYKKYVELSKSDSSVIFSGRLGLYKYLDMDDVVKLSLDLADKELNS